jgi:hypothetical protein
MCKSSADERRLAFLFFLFSVSASALASGSALFRIFFFRDGCIRDKFMTLFTVTRSPGRREKI